MPPYGIPAKIQLSLSRTSRSQKGRLLPPLHKGGWGDFYGRGISPHIFNTHKSPFSKGGGGKQPYKGGYAHHVGRSPTYILLNKCEELGHKRLKDKTPRCLWFL